MGRRVWLGVIASACAICSFLALLVVGSYSAASTANGTTLAAGTVPAAYSSLIEKWGNLCSEISPPLLAALLYQESGFGADRVSPVGAQGIAQFMPATWASHGLDGNGDGNTDVWDPADAIPAAANYLCVLAKDVASVPGDPTDNMLAAYNAGPYRVISAGGVPNITETRNYVRRIRELAKSFAAPDRRVATSGQAAGAIYFAQSKLGTPYLWGGTGSAADGGRFDCSGLTQAAYASVGIRLPRVANDQWYAGPHPPRGQLQPGDLVFFAYHLTDPRTIHHVGIYVGGGYMINAPYTGAVIRYDKIDSPDYIGATRVTRSGAEALPANNS